PDDAVAQGFDVDRRFNLRLLGELNVKYVLSEYPLRSDDLVLVHAPAERPRAAQSKDYATGLVNSPRDGYFDDNIIRSTQQLVEDTRAAISTKLAGKDVFIYQLLTVQARYRLAGDVRVMQSDAEILDVLASSSVDTLRVTAWLKAGDALGG